jgi:hypothetical protein
VETTNAEDKSNGRICTWTEQGDMYCSDTMIASQVFGSTSAWGYQKEDAFLCDGIILVLLQRDNAPAHLPEDDPQFKGLQLLIGTYLLLPSGRSTAIIESFQ